MFALTRKKLVLLIASLVVASSIHGGSSAL